jgi:hypothetical protein
LHRLPCLLLLLAIRSVVVCFVLEQWDGCNLPGRRIRTMGRTPPQVILRIALKHRGHLTLGFSSGG